MTSSPQRHTNICMSLCHLQEVAEQVLPHPRHYRLRVELHPLDGVLPVPHPHDDAALAARAHLQALRHALRHDGQRVVADRFEGVGQPRKDAAAVVLDDRHLAVLDLARALDPPAERLADALVAEADAEDGHLPREVADELDADARLARRARPGRDDQSLRRHRLDLDKRYHIVAGDAHVRPQLAQVLVEVVREAVVVIDQKEHVASYAGLRALKMIVVGTSLSLASGRNSGKPVRLASSAGCGSRMRSTTNPASPRCWKMS